MIPILLAALLAFPLLMPPSTHAQGRAALLLPGALHGRQQSIAQQEVALIQQAGKYVQAKDYANAIQTYQSVIKLNPKMAAPYSGLGDVYMLQGKYQLAVTAYKQFFVLGTPDLQ